MIRRSAHPLDADVDVDLLGDPIEPDFDDDLEPDFDDRGEDE